MGMYIEFDNQMTIKWSGLLIVAGNYCGIHAAQGEVIIPFSKVSDFIYQLAAEIEGHKFTNSETGLDWQQVLAHRTATNALIQICQWYSDREPVSDDELIFC
jgi:hypothetical protein